MLITSYQLTDAEIKNLHDKTNQPIADIKIANRVLSAQITRINQLADLYDKIIDEHHFKFARELFDKAFSPFENHHLDDINQLMFVNQIYDNLNEIVKAMQVDIDATKDKNNALMLQITNSIIPILNQNLDALFAVVNDFELGQFNPLLKLDEYQNGDFTLVATIDGLAKHQSELTKYVDQLDYYLDNRLNNGNLKYVIKISDQLTLPSVQGIGLIESIIFDAKEQLLQRKEEQND